MPRDDGYKAVQENAMGGVGDGFEFSGARGRRWRGSQSILMRRGWRMLLICSGKLRYVDAIFRGARVW